MTGNSRPRNQTKDQKVSDLQINDSVNFLIGKYGKDAPLQAKQRADELVAIGNHWAGNLWLDIYRQIKKTLEDK